MELQRKHFTRHGQHLNYEGKELIALEMAKTIDRILNKVKITPVQVKWKDEEESVHATITVPINSTLNIEKNVRNKMEANIYKDYQDCLVRKLLTISREQENHLPEMRFFYGFRISS